MFKRKTTTVPKQDPHSPVNVTFTTEDVKNFATGGVVRPKPPVPAHAHARAVEARERAIAERDRALAERDEVMDLLTKEQGLSRQYRDLVEAQNESIRLFAEALERDVATIAQAVAPRVSAVSMIGICREIMDGRSAASASIAGALTVGYSRAKEAEAAAKDVD